MAYKFTVGVVDVAADHVAVGSVEVDPHARRQEGAASAHTLSGLPSGRPACKHAPVREGSQ